MTNIVKTCIHSNNTLFCDVCNKISDFEYSDQATCQNMFTICSSEQLGYGPSVTKGKKDQHHKDQSDSTVSLFKFKEIIKDIKLEDLKKHNLDDILLDAVRAKGITLSPDGMFILQQLAYQALRSAEKKEKKDPTLYMEWIRSTSNDFKNFINSLSSGATTPLYNISKIVSEKMPVDILNYKKTIILNSYVNFNNFGVSLNIHPIVVALFFQKIKGLDFQVVHGLPQRLISNILTNKNTLGYGERSDLHLLFNKLSMHDSSNVKNIKEFEEKEQNKILFSIANRGDILNVRSGNFAAQTLTAKLSGDYPNSPDFINYYIQMLDIYPLIYKNNHYSYIKIRLEATTNKNPYDISNTRFREQFNGNVIELVAATDSTLGALDSNQNTSLLAQFNDRIINNGYLIYTVDRTKPQNMRRFMLPPGMYGSGPEFGDPSELIDMTPVNMPFEMNIGTTSKYTLKSVIGYIESEGRKYPGFYYTILFTASGDMFYYTNKFFVFDNELPSFIRGYKKPLKLCERQQSFEVEDFMVLDNEKEMMQDFINRTAFLYVYDSLEHYYALYETA